MRGKHNCGTCKWHNDMVCVNVDSDYVSDSTDNSMWCYEWERRKEPEDLSNDALLGQLAEECAEYIQAYEKLKRAKRGENPTPMTVKRCGAKLIEEIADVQVCLTAFLMKQESVSEIEHISQVKRERWIERLNLTDRTTGTTARE